MIVAEDICMKYRQVFKEVVALKNISLNVKKGEIFGLIVISNFDNPSFTYRRKGFRRGV